MNYLCKMCFLDFKKQYVVVLLIAFLTIEKNSLGQYNERAIPAGYYTSAANLNCAPLKTTLKNIITTGHTPKTYAALWTRYLTDDIKPREVAPSGTYTNTPDVIWDMYSDNPNGVDPYNFTPGAVTGGGQQDEGMLGSAEGQRYNREHSVPTSWFNGNTGTSGTATDYIFIFPVDKRINILHSNDLYGKVGTTGVTTTLNGTKSGLSATGYGYPAVTVFEPIDSFKGDIARAFFYFVTRYQDNIPGWAVNTTAFANNTYPAVESSYLAMMKSWHALDPVSTKEINRNDASYIHQGNRNPYIDSPQFVARVWDNLCLAALPLNFIFFTATQQSNYVALNWQTAGDYNMDGYIIEKSYDNVLFYSIGNVAKNFENTYTFIDPRINNQATTVYYRIKKITATGNLYSTIQKVNLQQKHFYTLHYLPNSRTLYLQTTTAINKPTTVQIVNSYGSIVYQAIQQTNSTSLQLQLPFLSKGVYAVRIQNSAIQYTKQIVVE